MILDMFKLDEKVAIVTGSSTGLGQGISIALAEAGADVVGVDYVESPETKKIIEGLGRRYLEVVANLLTIKAIPDILAKTLKTFGRLDILVNNAGTGQFVPFAMMENDEYDRVMDINVRGIFFFSRSYSAFSSSSLWVGSSSR